MLWQKNIAGRFGQPGVRGDDDGDNRVDPAAIKIVGLNDKDRPAEAGF